MAERLGTQLQSGGLEQSIHTGLLGSGLFGGASLDLNFAVTKNVGPLVSFTRASNATYIDSAGTLRTAVTNLLLRSEEFDNAYWVKTETTVSANTTVAPDGATTADKLVESTTNSQHILASAAITWAENTQYTATFYAKAGERFNFDILLGTAENWVNSERVATFNLNTGTILFPPNSPAIASIQAVGNGWYRCRVTATTVASPSASAVFIRMADSTGLTSYQGIAGYGIFLWGAQLEQSSTVGEYIPTTSATNSAPRFDHNPTTGESLGLLVEEQRTNLLLNTATLSTQSVTVTAVAHTLSFYGSGTVTLSGVSTAGPAVGSGAFPARTTLTFTPTAGTLTLTVTGSVTSAQLEAGAFPTSYIPTTAAAATRSVDVASITGANFSSWYRQDEGTVFADITRQTTTGFPGRVRFWDGTAANIIDLYYDAAVNSSTFEIKASSTSSVQIFGGGVALNSPVRAAAGWQTNNAAVIYNSSILGTDSSVVVPVVDQMRIATGLTGTIKRLTFWPQRLPNSTLVALTQ